MHSTLFRLCLAGSALASTAFLAPAPASPLNHAFTAADAIGPADPARALQFEVILPLRNTDALQALLERQQLKGSPDYHKWITPAAFHARFGADDATVAAVTKELTGFGFTVHPLVRSLRVSGTPALIKAAFGADLTMVRDGAHVHPVALTGMRLTPALQAAGAHIVAFGNRRILMHPHSSVLKTVITPDNRLGSTGAYFYNDLKQAYGYPAVNATVVVGGVSKPLNGSGVTIAALMSSDILDADIRRMFKGEDYLKHASLPYPSVTHEYLDGATPGVLTDAWAEASLDTQMETGGATGAKVILYDIPDLSDNSIIAGYTDIDDLNEADVVSSSFGAPEPYYTAAYNGGIDYTYIFQTYHELFEQGNAEGITFLASSGDAAGRAAASVSYFTGGHVAHYIPSIENPASDPNVTAVGGTNLVTAYSTTSLNSAYHKENAWSDPLPGDDPYGLGILVSDANWGAGGGASVVFSKPSYQTPHIISTMRTTPDVGMQVGGCPYGAYLPCNGGDKAINGNGNSERSFVAVYIGGGPYGLIGTSVSSPEFASAVAILVEMQGRQGNLNPYLYNAAAAQFAGTASGLLHSTIPGYNTVHPNTYPAADYNYTTGVGTPYVAALMGVPPGTKLAGVPQSISNP
jgi:subtilase family serine protease